MKFEVVTCDKCGSVVVESTAWSKVPSDVTTETDWRCNYCHLDEQPRGLQVGDIVHTTAPEPGNDEDNCKWGVRGVITEVYHSTSFDVMYEDGTVAAYSPEELAPESEWIKVVEAARIALPALRERVIDSVRQLVHTKRHDLLANVVDAVVQLERAELTSRSS